jgi:hypothetical protein
MNAANPRISTSDGRWIGSEDVCDSIRTYPPYVPEVKVQATKLGCRPGFEGAYCRDPSFNWGKSERSDGREM